MIFSCAGAAHSGQVANRAAVQLTEQGLGQIFCLAAVSAQIEDKLERSRNAAMRVAIDGCEDHCARRTLEAAGLPVDVHLDLTTLGIEKKPAQPSLIQDAKKAVIGVEEAIGSDGSRQGCC